MAQSVEIVFMNGLPVKLRPAAQRLYLKTELDELVAMRFGGVFDEYKQTFKLSGGNG